MTGLNLSTPRMPERHTHEDEKAEKRTISSSSQNIKRNLSGLMKLLENGDFEEAKKLTQYLVNCPSASGINGPITDHDRQCKYVIICLGLFHYSCFTFYAFFSP